MALNIKDDITHDLVRQIAAITGESQSAAVRSALEERLARLLAQDRLERVLTIAADAGSRMTAEEKAVEHGYVLYDELGLPR